MTTNPKPHGPAPKYINATSRDYLTRCFPGLIPAVVIAEALREKAVREGRLTIHRQKRLRTTRATHPMNQQGR
jgi:hypothetical protein